MYRLQNVCKSYGNTAVLAGLNCEIRSSGFTFILGPSGAGKSTLLRLLSMVEVPDAGRLTLQMGEQTYRSDEQARPWPRLTTVFQRQFLWPHLTLRDNIALPLRAARRREAKSKIEAVIELFDMGSFVDRYPNEVSGGQAQRAALARALALDPEMILIDEAHGGLDIEQQAVLNGHLVNLHAAGVGLIVVTHSLAFARRFAEQVVVVENGAITEVGPKTVFDRPKSPFLRRVLSLQTSD